MGTLALNDETFDLSPSSHCCYTQFHVGGVSVDIRGYDRSDITLPPLLQPFQTPSGHADVHLRVEWVENLSRTNNQQLFDSGCIWQLSQGDGQFEFDFSAPFFGPQPYRRLVIDTHLSSGKIQLNTDCAERGLWPGIALSYPLDELLIMHRLTQEPAIELHGVGMVGPDGQSNLFVGHSGAGKSTTARLWTSLHQMKILSDDRIIVRESPARDLRSGDHPRQIFMYGTPWHGEACFALPDRAPLQRIFVLEHGRGNLLTRLNKSETVAELFARSFVPFHRHQYIDHALSFLEQVADSIPCYRYQFEPDQRAVERIIEFRD